MVTPATMASVQRMWAGSPAFSVSSCFMVRFCLPFGYGRGLRAGCPVSRGIAVSGASGMSGYCMNPACRVKAVAAFADRGGRGWTDVTKVPQMSGGRVLRAYDDAGHGDMPVTAAGFFRHGFLHRNLSLYRRGSRPGSAQGGSPVAVFRGRVRQRSAAMRGLRPAPV